MSGLFLRLAAQASGQRGATLHSPAALPYQGLPAQLEPATPFFEDAPAATPRAAVDQPVSAAAIELSPLVSAPSSQAALVGEAAAEILGTRPGRLLDRNAPLGMLAMPGKPESIRDENKVPSPSSAVAAASHASATIGAQPVPAPQSDAVPVPEQARQHTRPSLDTPAGSARHDALSSEPVAGTSTDAPLLPAPLLSPPAAASAQPKAPVAPVAAGPGQPADEIHIHIGRIEVTAIQETAPSKRPARKGAAPLSLDDYLARRKGDGR
jgi:hypothetical protein